MNVKIHLAIFAVLSASLICHSENIIRKETDIGGIYTNWWIDPAKEVGVEDGKIRIGQTFRCPGDKLEEVGFGIWRFKGGLSIRKQVSNVVFLLRKGGINGKVIKKRIFPKGKVPQKSRARLKVHMPSTKDTVWYFEVQILNPKLPEGAMSFNARKVDCYPFGDIYFNGREVKGELALKVIWSKTLSELPKGKFVFWSARPEHFISMRADRVLDLMVQDEPKRPVRILAAQNEYEVRQFIITPNNNVKLKKVELQIMDLRSNSGAAIDRKNITTEWMRYVLEWPDVKGYERFMPDPLSPTNIAHYDSEDYNGRINEKTNTVFWVTFYVPKDTPTGIYRGRAIAIIDDKVKLTRDVELKVLDIALPIKTHTRTALFRGEESEWLVRDLAKYRISAGALPANPKLFVKFGRLMNKLGVAVTFVGPWGCDLYDAIGAISGHEAIAGDVDNQRKLKALARCQRYYEIYYPILKREGWLTQAYSRLPDEFRSMEMAKRACGYVQKVRQWAPGIRILVTGIGNDRRVLERAVGCCDIWCPSIRYCESNLDFYRQRLLAGDKVWPYIHEFTWYYYPAGFLRYYFWALHKYGFDGVCYWTVGPRGKFTRTKFGFVRDDNVCPGDGTLYYPNIKVGESIGGRGGMAGTKSFEPRYWHSARLSRIRDGIEDMEYFWLMKEAIEKAKTRGNIAASVYRDIKEVNKFIKDFAYAFDYFTADSEKLDEIRAKITTILKGCERDVGICYVKQ